MYSRLSDGTRLFYDVYGSHLNVSSLKIHVKPIVLFLHGGPGIADHTLYIKFWSKLSHFAQVIFLDMRGHERSDKSTPDKWNLKQWGNDVYEFCNNLGLKNPVIAGFFFGGWVALSYATQFPASPGKLILCNTEAKVDFDKRADAYHRKGGEKVAQIVRDHANNPSKNNEVYYEICFIQKMVA